MKRALIALILLIAENAGAISVSSLPVIESIQSNLAVTDGSTATILPVDTTRSVIVYNGSATNSANDDDLMSYLAFSNSTTVAATGNANPGSMDTYFSVIQFARGTVKSLQNGSITIGAGNLTNTATLSPSVVAENAMVFLRGGEASGATDSPGDSMGIVRLTNGTTVTAARKDNEGVLAVYYTVVEFYSWVIQ